jgi:hypothetical protein
LERGKVEGVVLVMRKKESEKVNEKAAEVAVSLLAELDLEEEKDSKKKKKKKKKESACEQDSTKKKSMKTGRGKSKKKN